MKYKWILAISLIVLIFTSGCITTNSNVERRIGEIYTGESLSLPREDVLRINYSEIESQIQQLGYTSINDSEGDVIGYIFTKMINNTHYPCLWIGIFSSLSKSFISAIYNPEGTFPESKLDEKKQYLMDRVNEIAQICNLTIDWSNVQWSISYQD